MQVDARRRPRLESVVLWSCLSQHLDQGDVAELADAKVSKTFRGNLVWVRFPPSPPSGSAAIGNAQKAGGSLIAALCKKRVLPIGAAHCVPRPSSLCYEEA